MKHASIPDLFRFSGNASPDPDTPSGARRTKSRIFGAVRHIGVFVALCLSVLAGAFASAGETAPLIAILHTNDVHGRFAASPEAIGHDKIAALYREARERTPATLLLDAGDAVQGDRLVNRNRGETAIDIMNRVGYDGMTLGNHEFDYGWERVRELRALAEFPFFTQPAVSGNEPGFEAAAVYERGGRRIGVFGLTTPETRQSSTGGFGKDFGDTEYIVAYAAAMARSLRNAGAEVVICLAHLGVENQGFITSYDLRDAVDGIDVIIDGHSHTALADIEQAVGRALVVSAGYHGKALGVVEFFCENGRLRPVARSILRDAAEVANVVPDPAAAGVIAKWVEISEAEGARVVARSPIALDGERDFLRTRETEIGNLLADAIRAATGADAAVINGGSIRASLPAGELTVKDLQTALPYDTSVVTASLRGGDIREALETSVANYPINSGGFLQVSGLTFAFDPEKPAGRRVIDVVVGGRPLDPDAMYFLALTDWLASGGDGYEMFIEPCKRQSQAEPPDLIDILVRHLNDSRTGALTIEGRIVAKPGHDRAP